MEDPWWEQSESRRGETLSCLSFKSLSGVIEHFATTNWQRAHNWSVGRGEGVGLGQAPHPCIRLCLLLSPLPFEFRRTEEPDLEVKVLNLPKDAP